MAKPYDWRIADWTDPDDYDVTIPPWERDQEGVIDIDIDEFMLPKEYANGGGVGSMMQPKKKFEMQGGVKNYLGNQKMVTAPKYWKSRPNKPQTELAYITKTEKDLITPFKV